MKNLFLAFLMFVSSATVAESQCPETGIVPYTGVECNFDCTEIECNGVMDYWCYSAVIDSYYMQCYNLNTAFLTEQDYIREDAHVRRMNALREYQKCLNAGTNPATCSEKFCERITKINLQTQEALDAAYNQLVLDAAALTSRKCAELQACCTKQ